jgi:hypothetical protein
MFAFQPPPADYPNHLAAPQPERPSLPSARWLMLGLLLLCLVPRMVAALRIPSICIDGAVYVNTARALEAGNIRAALFEGAVNLYAVILMLLHRFGLEWEVAGAAWGVTISSLVVLPLWGWVRRQFDDRVALLACLLYAVHPKFIIESPEVMRDATFWFLFMLAIYSLWRAVAEVRYGWFIAAGAAITLSVLTRIEGIFLVIPLVLWTFWRFLALQEGRRKLLVGATACVLVFPLLLGLVNIIWLAGHADVATIRVSPLARVQPWLASLLGHEATEQDEAFGSAPHLGRMLWVFVPTMTRGLAPIFALLMFGGMWGWRRLWARRDHQALFITAVILLVGIWVQLWIDNNISRRYALPIVLMASPFAALGLWGLMARIQRIGQWLGWQERRQRVVAGLVLVGILFSGLGHTLTSNYDTRRMMADLGRWTGQAFADSPTVVGPSAFARIVPYYAAKGSYVVFPYAASDASMLKLVAENRADVVILWAAKPLGAARCLALRDQLKSQGLEPLAAGSFPKPVADIYVLARAKRLAAAPGPRR